MIDDWIDISVPLRSGMVRWPDNPPVQIERVLDRQCGDTATVSTISMGSHTGTHMDAPLHFIPGGKGLDKMPLSATIGPARVIEIHDPESIKPEELYPHQIRRNERILFKTRNSSRCWQTEAFIEDFVYISQEAARYLASLEVQTVGVDYLSVGGFRKDGVETHQALLSAGIWIVEGLDLSKVKPGKYDLICLPLKILQGDGGPARAILRASRESDRGMEKLAETQYPIHELLQRRWSPRAYSERLVEPEKLCSLLEAARWAPSSFNEQPWIFIVATKENPVQYERLLSCLVEKNMQWAKFAPVLMLSVAKLHFERNGKENRHAFHDVGLAVENLVIQAMALGLFGQQMAGFYVEKARELFGIPEGYEPVAAIALGYMGDPQILPEQFRERELLPRTRKPLEAFVFTGHWGKVSPLVSHQDRSVAQP